MSSRRCANRTSTSPRAVSAMPRRATLIPTLTMPVSLIGAFAFVNLMGFSINTLTLFAIVLATGIVVDDAIVVIETIERHVQEYRKGAHQAASDAMREV